MVVSGADASIDPIALPSRRRRRSPRIATYGVLVGGAVLMVPKGWTVDMQATSILGGIKDERFGDASNDREGRGRGRPRRSDDQEAAAPVPPPSTAPPATVAPSTDLPAQGQVDVPVERADSATPAGNAPRLIVRGFIMMGGLVIKS